VNSFNTAIPNVFMEHFNIIPSSIIADAIPKFFVNLYFMKPCNAHEQIMLLRHGLIIILFMYFYVFR
jgi:hypothetical protein